MPDAYGELRSLPLLAILAALGFSEWKARKQDSEWFGPCPDCKPKRNRANFSFERSVKFNCFSCSVHGRGAIDLTQAVRGCSFKEAVTALETFRASATQIRARPRTEPPAPV